MALARLERTLEALRVAREQRWLRVAADPCLERLDLVGRQIDAELMVAHHRDGVGQRRDGAVVEVRRGVRGGA